MRLWRLVLLVLLLFVVGSANAKARQLSRSVSGLDAICHTGGAPCPDTDDWGQPCGPQCACTCCPGHGAAVSPAQSQPLWFSLPPSEELTVSPQRDLHPREVCLRIFHPPRA
jgi:hypothetical protein